MVQKIEAVIRKLQAYNDRTFPILSVYLEVPEQAHERNEKMCRRFNNLIEKNLKPEQIPQIQSDLSYTDAYLKQYQHNNDYKSIALFSGDNKLWEVINIYDQLPDFITVSHTPYLKPLIKVLGKYRRYLVILADREKARFFTLHMGQLEYQGNVYDPSVPQKVKRRGAAELSGKIDSHIQDHLRRHLLYIGQQVDNFTKNKQINGVIIGGHKELLRNMKDALPKHLQTKTLGEFVSELNVDFNEVLIKSKNIINSVDSRLNQQQTFSLNL